MKSWQKLVLILGGSAVVSVGVLGVLGYHFVWKKKDQIMAATVEAGERGAAFGKGKSQSACVDEAMRRVTVERGIQEEALLRLWLRTCLEAAQADTTCEGVPPPSELMRSVAWAMAQCDAHQLGQDQACVRMVSDVQKHCTSE